jgi:hypothetical protein
MTKMPILHHSSPWQWICFALFVWLLVDIYYNPRLEPGRKLLWMLFCIVVPPIAPLIYLTWGRNRGSAHSAEAAIAPEVEAELDPATAQEAKQARQSVKLATIFWLPLGLLGIVPAGMAMLFHDQPCPDFLCVAVTLAIISFPAVCFAAVVSSRLYLHHKKYLQARWLARLPMLNFWVFVFVFIVESIISMK